MKRLRGEAAEAAHLTIKMEEFAQQIPVNSTSNVSVKFCKTVSNILFSCSLPRVTFVLFSLLRRMKNLSSRGLLTLGKPSCITTSTSDGLDAKMKQYKKIINNNASV